MKRTFKYFTSRQFGFCCVLAAACAAPDAACLAAPAAMKPTGPISMDYKRLEYSPAGLHLFGGVTLTSDQYLVSAGDVLVEQGTAAGKRGVKRVTATPLSGAQVSLTFQDVAEAKSMKALADKAVVVPDASRPGGARIDLTGHVLLEMNAGAALDGPSVTTLDKATILLGSGPEYPRIEGEHGHTTLTPQF